VQRQVRQLAALFLCGCATVARVEKPEFACELRVAQGKAIVSLEARGGFHVNPDYPIHFDEVGREHFRMEEHHASAEVPRKKGVLAFSVCDAERCLIEKVALGR
jgi:hypothetical protein